MHAELAAVPSSLYHFTPANRVIASVSMAYIQRVDESHSLHCLLIVVVASDCCMLHSDELNRSTDHRLRR
jgi:hypothetical protein